MTRSELITGLHYLRAQGRFRRLRGAALERFQDRRARRVVEFARAHSAYHRDRFANFGAAQWRSIPAIGKAEMMGCFDSYNTRGIALDRTLDVALRAESTRDFRETLNGTVVGLSSGTSGHRGIYLIDPWEQAAWAGVMLARGLDGLSLRRVTIALFHRANNRANERLNGGGRRFRYFDLMMPLSDAIAAIDAYRPDVLVAPPSLLGLLAVEFRAGRLQHRPVRIMSAAEVLEPQDSEAIGSAFDLPVHQIYLCTEGLIAVSCTLGHLHLQEDVVAVQIEPLPSHGDLPRGVPIVTDLWRTAQPIIRYRLNDVLQLEEKPCPCGSGFRVIAQIEGRCDDVFYFPDGGPAPRPVYPDTIRRMVLLASAEIRDYQAFQDRPGSLRIHLETAPDAFDGVRERMLAEAVRILALYGCRADAIQVDQGLEPVTPGRKRRRVQRLG
jgi:putative adenylate-forming enzyme